MEKKVIKDQQVKLDVILYLLLIGGVVCLLQRNQRLQEGFTMIIAGTILQTALDPQGFCKESLSCI